MAFTHAFSLI